jgi:hypothetical protein
MRPFRTLASGLKADLQSQSGRCLDLIQYSLGVFGGETFADGKANSLCCKRQTIRQRRLQHHFRAA